MAKSGAQIEGEHHIVGVRMRVVGSGNLQLKLQDLQDVQNLQLVDLPLSAVTRFEPTRLSNFQSQRTRLVVETNEINEWFKINRIIIFTKMVAREYPG